MCPKKVQKERINTSKLADCRAIEIPRTKQNEGKKKKAPDGNLVKKKRISLTLKVDMASRTLSYKEQCTFIDQEFLKTIQ